MLEWAQLPSLQVARVEHISNSFATCSPHRICPSSGILTPLGVRPIKVLASSLTPSITYSPPSSSQVALVHENAGKAPHPIEQIGMAWPLTLERRAPLPISSLTVSLTRQLIVAQKWRTPRTMNKGGIFYPFLATNLPAQAQRQEQKEISKASRHPLLTEKLAEVQYRVLHSGYWIGQNKCNAARGDDPTCKECGQLEDIVHVFCSCHKITQLWHMIFKWWQHRTKEEVSVPPPKEAQ